MKKWRQVQMSPLFDYLPIECLPSQSDLSSVLCLIICSIMSSPATAELPIKLRMKRMLLWNIEKFGSKSSEIYQD